MSLRAAGALAVVVAVLGCAGSHKPPRIGDPGPRLANPEQEKAYQDLLGRFTREAQIYDQIDTRVFAAATFQSWRFREARVRREAAFKVLPPPVVEERLAEERAADAEAYDFHFGAFVNDFEQENFGRYGIWRIVLVTRAGEVTPLTIERIGRSDLNMRAYYPYLGDFWNAWRFRFPKKMPDGTPVLSEGETQLTLRVASTIGKIELTYPVE